MSSILWRAGKTTDELQGEARALRTEQMARRIGWRRLAQNERGAQQGLYAQEARPGSRMQEAEVTHALEARRQDVLEEALKERLGRESAGLV